VIFPKITGRLAPVAEQTFDEIAKMLSGSTVTSAAIEQARCLLEAK